MKRFKKMMALVIALVMTMMYVVPMTAMAADTHSISLKSTDTHTYRVFQVLTGTLSEDGSTQLGNPEWGADAIANPGEVNDFIDSITEEGLSQQEIADLVAAKVNTDSDGRGTVDKNTPITGLATGYYILVDITELEKYGSDPEKIDTQALHVVQVVNDIVNMEIKWGTTEDKKQIVSDTLGKDEEGEVNTVDGDTDNVSIGDTVNYQITAKIPANANLYNYFYFVINDTLDTGLTLDEDSIKVYKDSVAEANLLSGGDEGDYVLKTGDDAGDYSFQIGLNDAKSLNGKTIIVIYSAELNENATIGEVPNKNTSTVEYSNNPNHEYDGKNNPSFPSSEDDDAMGETPVTETETYTTGIQIQKVDQDGNVLSGATFKLSGLNTKKVLTVQETFAVATDGNYYKLKDGTYTKTAPTSDGEYMVKTEGATSGYVIDASYNGDDKKVVDGITYRPYAPATDEGKDVYVLHNGNAHLYDSTTTKYKKTTTKTIVDATSTHEAEKAVDSNGLARFDGLGAGTYTLSETVTPPGYTTADDINITVVFTEDGNPVWSFSGGNGTYDADEGIYKITIENVEGTPLPSTGGIGTTLFYIFGSILVIGAGILLVTRRRMKAQQ